jgi:hypothetical protein
MAKQLAIRIVLALFIWSALLLLAIVIGAL